MQPQKRPALAPLVILWLAAAALSAAQVVPETSSASAVAQPGPAQPDAANVPLDALPSTYSLSVPRRHSRVLSNQEASITERRRLVTRLPELRPLSAVELQAARSGVNAPGKVPSSDAVLTDFTPEANGAAGAAYADSRFGTGADYASVASKRVGRLLVRSGGVWYQCTASVINRALLLTAAHCVCDYGKGALCFPDKVNGQLQVTFQPGLDNATVPYGEWTAAGVMVLTPYSAGTDTGDGVSVNNDLAVIWTNPSRTGKQIGDVTGYLGYAYNDYSFVAPVAGYGVPTAPATAMLTQFGYPVAFDNGKRMQISNAATYTLTGGLSNLKNIIRGSAMTGGSSGGPWLANYGVDSALDSGVTYGSNSNRNVVMGVTSWGYDDDSYKVMGASSFGTNKEYPNSYGTRGAGNVAKLMYDACDNTALPAWNLKAKGLCV